MEMNDFISNFADQFDEIDTSSLTPDTKFRDLEEWSSLLALSIMAMIDEEYDVQIKADDMRKSNTIKELFDIVQTYLNK